MAEKQLKTLTFPGLSTTYVIPEVDPTSSVSGNAADAKVVGDHIKDKDNPHGVTVEQIGAAPASHATDKNNPHNITIAQIGAAPDGYGLGLTGSHLTAITDANEAQRNGWYLIDKNTANGVGANAIMRVEAEAWAHCVQTAYGASHSSSRPLIRQRVKCNGTWSGWVDCDPAAFALASHSQAASTITGGTFAGPVYASNTAQAPITSQLRNSRIASSEITPSNNGEICWIYE